MKINRFMLITVLLAVVLSPAFSAGGEDFDDLLNQAAAEKNGQWEAGEAEIERTDQAFEALWQKRKSEIERKWDKALRSTRKEWVDYNDNLDAVSLVDFEQGFVEISAVVPVTAQDTRQVAEKLISDKIKQVFSADNAARANVLADQVAIAPAQPLTPAAEPDFIRKTTREITFAPKPFVPKDGIKRVKASLRFSLLPDHLAIRAGKYIDLVQRQGRRFGVLPELILAVIHTESYFNPLAVSPANAHGLMQLIPQYGARDAYRLVYGQDLIVTPDYLYQPPNNIELGTAYLSFLDNQVLQKIKDPIQRRYLAICSYNWGPGSITRKIIKPYDLDALTPAGLYDVLQARTPRETADYLKRVTERMKVYAKAIP